MSNPTTVLIFPYHVTWEELWVFISPQDARPLVEEALSWVHKKAPHHTWHQEVKTALTKGVQINGFREAWKAPSERILRILEKKRIKSEYGGIILKIGVYSWRETNADFVEQLRQWLAERGYLWRDVSSWDDNQQYAADWLVSDEVVHALIRRIKSDEAFKNIDEAKIALALYILWRYIPVGEETIRATLQQASLHETTNELLQTLYQLPADHPFWGKGEWRVMQQILEPLAISKRILKEHNEQKEKIKEQLQALRNWTELFDIPLEQWDIERLDVTDADDVIKYLQNLEQRIKTYQDLDRNKPKSRVELLQWHETLREELLVIEELIRTISRFFIRPQEKATAHEMTEQSGENESQVADNEEDNPGTTRVVETQVSSKDDPPSLPEADAPTMEQAASREAEEIASDVDTHPSEETATSPAQSAQPSRQQPTSAETTSSETPTVALTGIEEEFAIAEAADATRQTATPPPPPPEQPARITTSEDTTATHEQFKDDEHSYRLLQALAQDDLSLAYWIARQQEVLGDVPPFSSRLLEGMQLAQWLIASWPQPDETLREAFDTWQHESAGQIPNDEISDLWKPWLALIALLSATPNPWRWVDWIPKRFEVWRKLSPSLANVWEILRTIYHQANPASLDIQELFGHTDQRRNFDQIAKEKALAARRWLEQAPKRRTNYQFATWVWQALTTPEGISKQKDSAQTIYDWLSWVANDQRERRDDIEKIIKDWEHHLNDKLDEAVQRVSKRSRAKRIEGAARHTLLKRMREAIQIAKEWLEAVNIYEQRQTLRHRQRQQLQRLYQTLRQAFAHAPKELQAALSATSTLSTEWHLALKVLIHSLELARTSHEPTATPWTRLSRAVEQMGLAPRPTVLASRLFAREGTLQFHQKSTALGEHYWEPDLQNEHVKQWLLEEEAQGEWQASEQTVLRWADQANYELAVLASELLPDEQRQELQARLEERWKMHLLGWQQQLRDLALRLEEEHRYNLLSQEDYNRLQATLTTIETTLQRLYNDHTYLYSFIDLTSLREEVDALREDLDQRLENHRRFLQRRKEEVIKQLEGKYAADSDTKQRILAKIKQIEDQGDWRALDTYLLRLQAELQQGALEPELSLQISETLHKFLKYEEKIYWILTNIYKNTQNYNSNHQRLRAKWLNSVEVARQAPWAESTPNFPSSRLKEIRRASAAWFALKWHQDLNKEQQHVAYILKFLGIAREDNIYPDTSRVYSNNIKRWRVQTQRIQGGISESDWLPPGWASEANGHYEVVGIWGRPTPRQLLPLLKTAHSPQILLYFGVLTPKQREEWAWALRKERVKAILVDEVIFLFLAGYTRAEPQRLFHITLPFSYVNPYRPTGTVQEEMFFGRKRRNELLSQLREGQIGVLYGGRQLGKTALLRRAAEQWQQSGQNRYAYYIDLKELAQIEIQKEVWRVLARRLNIKVRNEQKVIEKIRERIQKGIELRIFFDEADELLKQESLSGFRLLHALRALETENRAAFKVVFAGLHQVQRYMRIPNHPFAQLGDVRSIGPLDYTDAEELLVIPMKHLGIELEPQAILRVLSYTNRHPGLLQLFAREIVNAVNRAIIQGQQPARPPFKVSASLIDQIYDNKQVSEEIRKRFQWTIDLHALYRFIALWMAYMALQDPPQWEHTPQEIAKELSDWLQWEKTPLPSVSEVAEILEEMVGLGVLLSRNGKYSLSSPNLLPLLGSISDIETELLEISDTDPTLQHERRRLLISAEEGLFAPFAEQEYRLLLRYNVSLIIGSPDMGAQPRVIRTALDKLTEGYNKDGMWYFEYRDLTETPEKHLDKLIKSISKMAKNSLRHYLLLLQFPTYFEPNHIERWLRKTYERLRKPSYSSIHIVYILSEPIHLLKWLLWRYRQGSTNLLEAWGSKINIHVLRPWYPEAVRQALEELGYLAAESNDLHLLTGGWHSLIGEIFYQARQQRLGANESLKPIAQHLRRQAVQGRKLRHAGAPFLEWMTDLPTKFWEILKTLLTLWDDGQILDKEIITDITDANIIDDTVTPDEFQAFWEFLIYTNVIRETKDGFLFDTLAHQRLRTWLNLDSE